MDRYLAVDGNFYLHKVFHTVQDADQNLVNHRFLTMICRDALATSSNKLMVAFDGPNVFRYKLYKEYKGTRIKDGPSPYKYFPKLLKFLTSVGIPVLQLDSYEADDILCSLSTTYKPITISCRDKDAFQYVGPGVVLYDAGAKPNPIRTDELRIKRNTGLSPKQFLQYQALIGDKIDNVPQLIKPAQAKAGLIKYESIKNWVAQDKDFAEILKSKKADFILNKKLVTLDKDCCSKWKWPPLELQGGHDLPKSYFDLKSQINSKTKSLF